MAYADFTLESAETAFGLVAQPGDLFPELRPVAIPLWLPETLERGRQLAALASEKARSEFLVGPILLAACESARGRVTVFSGHRLDVDPKRGLMGECDFIIALTPPIPRLRSPLATIVEAKRGEIELGLGQCVAQMVGAQVFNDRSGTTVPTIYGCVTTANDWQFLRLRGNELVMDRQLYFISQLDLILAALRVSVEQPVAVAA